MLPSAYTAKEHTQTHTLGSFSGINMETRDIISFLQTKTVSVVFGTYHLDETFLRQIALLEVYLDIPL